MPRLLADQTTSALTSSSRASRTCAYASRRSFSDETPFSSGRRTGTASRCRRARRRRAARRSARARSRRRRSGRRARAVESNETPPSTSGTPGSSACASKPVPTRKSDTRAPPAARRGLAIAIAPGGGLVHATPRAPADVHGDHAGRERGHDVVVDAVADVRDLRRLGTPDCVHDAREELGRGLRDAPDAPTMPTGRT